MNSIDAKSFNTMRFFSNGIEQKAKDLNLLAKGNFLITCQRQFKLLAKLIQQTQQLNQDPFRNLKTTHQESLISKCLSLYQGSLNGKNSAAPQKCFAFQAMAFGLGMELGIRSDLLSQILSHANNTNPEHMVFLLVSSAAECVAQETQNLAKENPSNYKETEARLNHFAMPVQSQLNRDFGSRFKQQFRVFFKTSLMNQTQIIGDPGQEKIIINYKIKPWLKWTFWGGALCLLYWLTKISLYRSTLGSPW